MTAYTLGTLTFGGYILFETPTEVCVMMVGEWQTVRISKVDSNLVMETKPSQE